MDQVDKAILRAVQSRLPIDAQPFAKLGQELGLSEEEVLARLEALKASGVIRRIGGNFNSRDLGFASTLCAAQVPADKLEEFVAAVNAFHGVTHNYRRSHQYNVWFTFIAQSMEQIEANLASIAARTGVSQICSLPARKMFKIKVDFPV
ncbi:MAG: AsnC family transcriptional regulator [Thermodesulfobacteriota bacterium]